VGVEAACLQDTDQDALGWLEDVAVKLGMDVGPNLLGLDMWLCDDCGTLGVLDPST
jgi:hypothetical protein